MNLRLSLLAATAAALLSTDKGNAQSARALPACVKDAIGSLGYTDLTGVHAAKLPAEFRNAALLYAERPFQTGTLSVIAAPEPSNREGWAVTVFYQGDQVHPNDAGIAINSTSGVSSIIASRGSLVGLPTGIYAAYEAHQIIAQCRL